MLYQAFCIIISLFCSQANCLIGIWLPPLTSFYEYQITWKETLFLSEHWHVFCGWSQEYVYNRLQFRWNLSLVHHFNLFICQFYQCIYLLSWFPAMVGISPLCKDLSTWYSYTYKVSPPSKWWTLGRRMWNSLLFLWVPMD